MSLPLAIVVQTGLARWAGTGPVRKSTAQARCGTACLVPVPVPTRHRAHAWAVSPARARHGFWAGTMRPGNSLPLDDL